MNEPIRIAQVVGKLCAGGVEAVTYNYYRHIDKSKIQFDFYYDADSPVEPPPKLIEAGARFIKVPPYQQLPAYIKALKMHFEEGKYQIVHSHLNSLSVFPLLAARLANIPIRIAHSHSTATKKEIGRSIIKYLLHPFSKVFANRYFACTRHSGEWLFGQRAFRKGKITVINNAIEVENFTFDAHIRDQLRKELNLEGKCVIGHVGRFVTQKNHSFLIDVFKDIVTRQSNSVLLLIGEGPLEIEVQEKVKSYKLSDHVIFAGVRTDINRFYQAMDIFLFPSLFEGLGIVLIEAQVAGLPCISADVVPKDAKIADLLSFVSLKNASSIWADTVISALMQEKGKRCGRVNEAIYHGYSIKTEVQKLEDMYLEMIYASKLSKSRMIQTPKES